MRTTTRLLGATMLVAVAIGSVSACSSDGSAKAETAAGTRTSTTAVALTVATPAPLVWGVCPPAPAGTERNPKQQCSSVRVPLYYNHPHGKQISIEVSRIKALKPTGHTRDLLVNPGGPALAGLDTPSDFAAQLPAAVRNGYDLIGFDPRGVEYSDPQTCHLNDPVLPDYFPFPAANGSTTANVALAKATAQRCSSITELKYFTTNNTARDLDVVRRALRQNKISYWGQSYGTYLGAVYASLFLRNVDRMVLEGNVEPTAHVWQDESALWSKGMADRFVDPAQYAAAHNAEIGLGTTASQVTRSYLTLAARLDRTPLPPGPGSTLTGGLLRGITYSLLLHNEAIPVLTQFWKAAADASAGHPTTADTAVLQQILGSISGPAQPGVPADNDVAMFMSLMCGDASWSHDLSSYARNTAADRAAYPLTAGMPANLWPCAFWAQPLEATVTISSHGARNILILQNERDNATPVAGALVEHQEFGRRSALVLSDNGGHYVYGTGSSCVDTTTDTFLTTGTLPRHDVHCTDVTPAT